jgi:DNA helicase HerA-like ATPase
LDNSISQAVPDKIIVPQGNPDKWILPSSTTVQGHFLSSYTPSPHDSQFALDLLSAIQNHTPLTLFQKIFIVFLYFPLPFNWKLAIFSFLYNQPQSHFPIAAILILIVLFILGIYIFKYLARLRYIKKHPLVFLELTFPSLTGKSAYATEQLFSLLHNLAGQRRFLHRIIGHKKQYSLEIAATREEGIRYILGVSATDAPIIQKSLLSYLPGLKIKEIKDYLPPNLRGKKRNRALTTGVIELKLVGDFVLPLQEYKVLGEHDPIAYLTGNMTKLGKNELIVFQAVVTPIMRSSHRGIVKHLRKIEQRIYQNRTLADKLNINPWEKIFSFIWIIIKALANTIVAILEFALDVFVMIWDTDRKSTPIAKKQKIVIQQDIQNPYEQELKNEIKKKIDQPMFETSLRLLVRSSDKEQYSSRISGFLASFGSLGSAYQSLVLKSRNLRSLLQSPLSALRTRQVSLSGNPILSTSELTDIYHFPYTETTKTEDMVKTKSQPLPAPLSFKKTTTLFDNVFATNSYGGSETVIGQTLKERQRHTYILGATGSGKTNLLSTMIYQDIINGKGVAVLDPHGQLIEKLLEVIPKERIKDVVWFAPDDDGYPIALNLLELPEAKDGKFTASQLQKQKSLISSSIISIIQKFYDAKFFGPRMEYVLKNTILTALETPNPTLITVLDLLTKTRYRKQVVAELENQVLKDYWQYEFEKLGTLQRNSVISPITNKIGGLLASPINYNILSQPKSKIDFEEIMNSGKILLCDLSKGKIGEDESSFFGSLVIAKIQLAALRRALIPEEKRKDFFLYVDEFQNFATLTFSELVSEARKYHLATILAHQSISQIEDKSIVKVILANVGTVICFKTANPEDEQFILPIFSPEVLKHEISNLPLYNFYMKVSVGQAEDSFLAEADNFTVKSIDKTAKAVIAESRKRYATKIESEIKPTDKNKDVAEDMPEQASKNTPIKQETTAEKAPSAKGLLP